MIILAYIILVLSLINLFRMVIFLIASDIYDIKNAKLAAKEFRAPKYFYSRSYNPLVSIIVPAHNEERTLERNLLSIINSTYRNIELIVVSNNSEDKTVKIARNFQRKYGDRLKKFTVIDATFSGKARALNEGLKHASGTLFMCLDADSALTQYALAEAVACFREKSLAALSSSVKIFPNKGYLNLLQRIEYLVCYQMKKAETVTRIQYIVGGIGSMYRTRILRTLNCYETDTITEDIDLSMKLLERYGQSKYIGYSPKVVVFTEAVTNFSDLLKQRFRWKYGRYQVFFKRKSLFWSRGKNQNPFFSWIYLPYALFAELSYSIEPLTIAFIFFLIIRYGDMTMLIGSFITFCFYSIIQISGATHGYSKKERRQLLLFAPPAYILMYVISVAEYVATIRGILNLKKLYAEHNSGNSGCAWKHVTRSGITTSEEI